MRVRTRLVWLATSLLCLAPRLRTQEPAPGLPSNYQVVLENPDVRVLRAHYGPHEKVPVHSHPAFPTAFIYLNDSGVVRLTHIESKGTDVVNRPPTHTGAFRLAPGLLERHSVENLGDVPADSVLVELKTLPKTAITEQFRGPAPAEPLLNATSVVYNNPALRIERVICDPGATCTLAAAPAPSVLVAVTPTALIGGSKPAMLTLQQPASWLRAGDRVGVRSLGPVPAQVLRLMLLKHLTAKATTAEALIAEDYAHADHHT